MNRRNFVQSLAAIPAAPALIAQQTNAVPPPGNSAGSPAAEAIIFAKAEEVAASAQIFFTPVQFATLRRLAAALVPAEPGMVGALDTDACEFLDFLLDQSPSKDQNLYRDGLDEIERRARSAQSKPFADLTAAQVDAIIQPLFVERHWDVEMPEDRLQWFMAKVHDDLRLATRNSPAAEAARTSSRSGSRGSGGGNLVLPLDPIYRTR